MALPATDAFTAADGTALTTYSASWTLNSGNFAINTNALYGNAGGTELGAHWNADAFNNNQYAEITIAARGVNSGAATGAGVRVHASAATYYGVYEDPAGAGSLYLFKMVAGTWTQLGSTGTALAVNDVLRIEADGTTIRVKVNGTLRDPPGDQTDTAIGSGSGGVVGYHNSNVYRADNWEGGDLAAAAPPLFPPWRPRIQHL